ncbi:MAG: glycosyltransferase, partial [Bacteroidia bacterium]
MKILHIVGSMDPASGGICNGIRNSDAVMTKLGATREVVCLDAPTSSYLGMDTFPVHALGPAKGPWQYSPKIKSWLIDNLGRFDVFIINGLWVYPSYIGWKVIKYLKKSTIKTTDVFVMPHGMLDPYFQTAPDRRLKAIRNWVYWKLIEKNILNDADAVLFTCEKEMQLAHKTFSNYRPKREINVGYGIMPPPGPNQDMYYAFIEKCKGVAFEPYLLFLSRIHEKKGVDMLIKAYAEVAEKALSEKKSVPKLVIAGPGLETAFGKKMIKLCNSFDHLKNLVFFPGMLSGDVKWGALYNCEAFILPSHQENFGIAVV